MPLIWNNGMMESWNIGLKSGIDPFYELTEYLFTHHSLAQTLYYEMVVYLIGL